MEGRLLLSRALTIAASLAAFILVSPAELLAQDLSEGQFWLQFLAIGQLSDDWRSHIEIQPRWTDDASELGLTIFRGAIGRTVSRRASLWGGYVGVPRTAGDGVRYEQRIWEQFLISGPVVDRWATTLRLRLEQRWLDGWANNSHRFRALVRAQRPLGAMRWSVAMYDESMFTIDETDSGPPQGFDRNRLYGGVVRHFTPIFSVEGGYIWENSTIANSSSHRNDHIGIAVVNVALPTNR